MGVLCAYPVRGEPHVQRNTNGEVAKQPHDSSCKQGEMIMGGADHL